MIKSVARVAAAVSLAVLIANFLTLQNRVVTTNPVLHEVSGLIGILALAGLVCSVFLLAVGSLVRLADHRSTRENPAARPKGASLSVRPQKVRFRRIKVLLGLLVFSSWVFGMPLYAYRHLISKAPNFQPGPWLVDVLFSVYAIAVQCSAPTPIALAFWPSSIMAVYLLFSRKDRPVLDGLFAIVSVGLVCGLWYILLRGITLGLN